MLLFVPFRQRSLFSSSSRRKSKTLTPSTTAPTTTMAGKQKNWLTWKGRYLADSAYTTLYDVAVRILTRRANARRSWRKSQKTMPRLSSVNTSAKMTSTRDDRRWAIPQGYECQQLVSQKLIYDYDRTLDKVFLYFAGCELRCINKDCKNKLLTRDIGSRRRGTAIVFGGIFQNNKSATIEFRRMMTKELK